MSTYGRAWTLGAVAVLVAIVAAGVHAMIVSKEQWGAGFWKDFAAEAVTNVLVAVVLALLLAAMADVFRQRDDARRLQVQQASRQRDTDALILALIGPVHVAARGYLPGELDVDRLSSGEAERVREQLHSIESFSTESFNSAMDVDHQLATLEDESAATDRIMNASDHLTTAFNLAERADRLFAVHTISDDLDLLHGAELDPELRRLVGTLRRRAFEVILAARRTDQSLAASHGPGTIADLMSRVPTPLHILSDANGRADAKVWREAIAPATARLTIERMQMSIFLDTAVRIVKSRRLDGGRSATVD